MAKIYLAGGLFNAGEQIHNLYLSRALEHLGHEVVLPQVEGEQCIINGSYDFFAIGALCESYCTDPRYIVVASGDGADAESGTSYEVGAAKASTGRAIVYRTDVRPGEGDLGVNAMLRTFGIRYVYEPATLRILEDIDAFYHNLAMRIDDAVSEIVRLEVQRTQ